MIVTCDPSATGISVLPAISNYRKGEGGQKRTLKYCTDIFIELHWLINIDNTMTLLFVFFYFQWEVELPHMGHMQGPLEGFELWRPFFGHWGRGDGARCIRHRQPSPSEVHHHSRLNPLQPSYSLTVQKSAQIGVKMGVLSFFHLVLLRGPIWDQEGLRHQKEL